MMTRDRRQEGPSPAAAPFKAPFVPTQAIGGKRTKDGGKFGYRDRARERREGAPPADLLSLLTAEEEDAPYDYVIFTMLTRKLMSNTSPTRPKQSEEIEDMPSQGSTNVTTNL